MSSKKVFWTGLKVVDQLQGASCLLGDKSPFCCWIWKIRVFGTHHDERGCFHVPQVVFRRRWRRVSDRGHRLEPTGLRQVLLQAPQVVLEVGGFPYRVDRPVIHRPRVHAPGIVHHQPKCGCHDRVDLDGPNERADQHQGPDTPGLRGCRPHCGSSGLRGGHEMRRRPMQVFDERQRVAADRRHIVGRPGDAGVPVSPQVRRDGAIARCTEAGGEIPVLSPQRPHPRQHQHQVTGTTVVTVGQSSLRTFQKACFHALGSPCTVNAGRFLGDLHESKERAHGSTPNTSAAGNGMCRKKAIRLSGNRRRAWCATRRS